MCLTVHLSIAIHLSWGRVVCLYGLWVCVCDCESVWLSICWLYICSAGLGVYLEVFQEWRRDVYLWMVCGCAQAICGGAWVCAGGVCMSTSVSWYTPAVCISMYLRLCVCALTRACREQGRVQGFCAEPCRLCIAQLQGHHSESRQCEGRFLGSCGVVAASGVGRICLRK